MTTPPKKVDIVVREVGLRDGLQSIESIMPTAIKCQWIDAAVAAGMGEIEVASFVPAKLLPQMADADAVLAHAREVAGLTVAALAPNVRGAESALRAGAHIVVMPISVSRSHCLANIRRTPDEAIAEAERVCRLRDTLDLAHRPEIEAGLSTAFGCTIEGAIDERDVVRLAVAAAEAGCDRIALADTTGYANPAQIRRLFRLVAAEIGDRLNGAHLHNTRGLGLANALAALDAGVTHFDSSLGGLGGCPFAPGATGNVTTEDLVFMFEAMGLATGIDLDRLIAIRGLVASALPGETLYGQIAAAGLPLGFRPAQARPGA